LHPLLDEIRLVGGLEEIEFRLSKKEGEEEKGEQPERISQFFWRDDNKTLTLTSQK
jgi:hypothetical protein